LPSRARPPFFAVRVSPIQGLGAFALRRIRKGTRIVEYVGERISPEEADARYEDEAAHPHVLLFNVDARTVIDAAVDGNDARFINHSCAPNCEAVDDDGRIYIHALRTIQPGEELSYDYRLEVTEEELAASDGRYACRCGAEGCRGSMAAPLRRKRRKG
jgi:SET domain-containing protein